MKRLLSWLLALVMIISCLPMSALPAFAAEPSFDVEGTTAATTEDFIVDQWDLLAGSSAENPYTVAWSWNETNTEATASVTIPAGKTMYLQFTQNADPTMSITANGEAVAWTAGNVWMGVPNTFTLTNAGEESVTYELVLSFPEGHQMNPKIIEDMLYYSDDVVQAKEDNDGFFYKYIAQGTGTVALYFNSVPGTTVTDDEGNETVTDYVCDIAVTNQTTGAQVSLAYDAVDNYGRKELQFEVAEGDVIIINIACVQDTEGNYYPAGTMSWAGTFTYAQGSEQNPIWVNEDTTVTIPAGETYYFASNAVGSTLDVTGEGTVTHGTATGSSIVLTGNATNMYTGQGYATFTIANTTEADVVYTLDLTPPLGSVDRPDELKIGDNTATISAGSQGYYYTWTAEEDGTLSITMPEGDWTYVINNLTAPTYGDTQWSDNDPVVNPGSVEVTAGDEIQIIVNTYNPADMWNNPAGTLTITAAFEAASKCEHANTTTTNTATCTEAGVETVVCNDCGETVSTTDVAALGHDYTGENGACIRCGEYQVDETLVFYNKTMLLGADIRGIFQVRKIKASSPYESFKVIVEKNGVETELELVATSDKTNYTTYGYALTVPAKEMADVVNAQIIGIKADGTYCVSNPDTWSIKIGTIALMDTYSAKTDEASVNKMKLCANMLNYGAEAQKKFSYNLDNLATDGLSDEYAAYIITTTPEMETIAKTDDTGATAPLKDIVFNLAARVQVLPRFTVAKTDAKEDYKAVINQTHIAPDGTETVYETKIIEGADCLKSGSTFAVYIDYLATKELRDVMTITLYKGDEAVSATHTFSAESVLYGLMDSYPTLIPALMNFCDCARAVFG